MFRGFKECIFLEKVNAALQNLENYKVLLKDLVIVDILEGCGYLY